MPISEKGRAIRRRRIVIFGSLDSVHVQRWVPGLTGRGFDIKLIGLGNHRPTDIDAVVFPRKGKQSYATYLTKAVAEARRFQPDLVHAHYATGYAAWLKRCGITPSLLSVWGADVIDFPSNWLKRLFVQHYVKAATYLSATSCFLKQRTIELVPKVADRISVIPFGVDVPDDYKAPSSSERVRLCFIKTHLPKYGPEVLLDAVKLLLDRGCPVELTMAGAGELTDRLKETTERRNMSDVVSFVGFIPNQQMLEFLRRHDIMVMPSTMDSESFGVAVLEAAAAGRPSVASRVGGVPEVVRDGETGQLVPPSDARALANAIESLVNDRQARERMGHAGYEFVKRAYSWERSLDMMSELYERLIAGYGK